MERWSVERSLGGQGRETPNNGVVANVVRWRRGGGAVAGTRLLAVLVLGASAGLAATAAPAEEPAAKVEPGPLDPSIARPQERQVVTRAGTAEEALRLFLRAHALHREGNLDGALQAYLDYEACDARRELPPRYNAVAERRLSALLEAVLARYDEACSLYRKDRGRGLAALRELAARYPALPVGRAALALAQSDELHQAITGARALDAQAKRPEALRLLAEAIPRLPAALFLYEAKSLLRDLGGPDLLAAESGDEPEKKDPETSIEVSGPPK